MIVCGNSVLRSNLYNIPFPFHPACSKHVLFCSIAEPNRSIVFDWIFVRFCSIRYPILRGLWALCSTVSRLKIVFKKMRNIYLKRLFSQAGKLCGKMLCSRFACLSCRPMIPCGRHPVMADMLVTLVSAVYRPTRLPFPVVIWSKYIDSEVLKCSVPSNGNVSRLYARIPASSSRLGNEGRPWFWSAVLYRSQNENYFLGRSKDAEALFGKISFFSFMC